MTGDRFVAVIVDAYHSSTQLVEEFRRRDTACVHVRTGEAPRTGMFPSLPSDAFVKVIDHGNGLKETASSLLEFDPFCIIPGSERAVELADALATELGLPGNGLEKSAARRDKFLMAETVQKHGLRTAQQFKSSVASDTAAWANSMNLNRTVIKPLHSAGTDSVFICSSDEDLLMRASSILGATHHLGLENEEVLVQEFIEGQEFVVNTVSYEGVHRVVGVWLYHKMEVPGVTAIYDWDELIDPSDRIVEELTTYTSGVLDALDIQFGPTHTEIMVDEKGPVLIECGARLDGLEYLPFAKKCMGTSQIETVCGSYLDHRRYVSSATAYHRKMHASNVLMITPKASKVRSTTKLSEIRALPSYVDMLLRLGLEGELPATIDYQTSPGVIFLAHESADQVQDDYRHIREIEKDGLFERI